MKYTLQALLRGLMASMLAGWAITAQGLSIDTMVLVSGQHPDGDAFTLTNNSQEPVFIRTELARIDIRDNQSHETPLTRDNLAQWTMTLDPALFILDPGESRKVNLRPLTEAASRLHDDVYAVSFVPQAHKTGMSDADTMNLQVGFRAFYVVPAGRAEMKYQLDYDRRNGQLTLDNRGNTALFAVLDQCSNGVREQPDQPCSMTFLALAGRVKQFEVPEWLRGPKMVFEVQNHDKRYRQQQER
ncbi:hypothetical protein [Aeromonas sp. SG16]|uniref:hypothetical protein n=1 Tax=Aeromonas sp. SG16 TaxID=2950548 RepID=UPI0021086964|nr:hypothetical protein [Aeromonas sp. SG16]MCQ4054432.1 hypothetical protein [Aeromonas sp. SG16]